MGGGRREEEGGREGGGEEGGGRRGEGGCGMEDGRMEEGGCGQEAGAVSFPPSSGQAPRPTSLLTQPRGWVPPSAFSPLAPQMPPCASLSVETGNALKDTP